MEYYSALKRNEIGALKPPSLCLKDSLALPAVTVNQQRSEGKALGMYVTQLELGYLFQITVLSASRKVLQKTEKAEKDIF